MKNENREILGISVQITGICESLPEAIEAAGSEQAVLNDFNANVLAHSHFTVVRKTIVDVLVKSTGIVRLTKKHGDKEVFAETEQVYVDRVVEELGEEGMAEHVEKVQTAVAALPVDYKPGTRGSGGTAKPAKKWFDVLDQLKKEGRFESFIEKHGIEGETEDDVLLAAAIKAKGLITAAEKAAKLAAASAL